MQLEAPDVRPTKTSGWWRRAVAGAVVGSIVLISAAPGPVVERSEDFLLSLRHSAVYHRALADLPLRYRGQAETATDEFERLTVAAIEAQFAVDVGPCFARWWAYEYMGLELTALSLELRRTHDVRRVLSGDGAGERPLSGRRALVPRNELLLSGSRTPCCFIYRLKRGRVSSLGRRACSTQLNFQ